MLFSSHVLAAGYVGGKIGNPFLAFLAGILIHLILDAIPHYDTTDKGKYTPRQWALVLVDFAIGLFIIFGLIKPVYNLKSPFLWGAFGGILPDLFDCPPLIRELFWKTKIGKAFHNFSCKIQAKHLKPVPGLLIQVFIIILFSYLYLHY